MTLQDIAAIRLYNQQIVDGKFSSVKDLVSWMGVLQAQDFEMAKWAIGVRIPSLKKASVEDAYNNGEIIRTHLLRPTWHFAVAEDVKWMLELTSAPIIRFMNSNNKKLGLTETVLKKCNKIIAKALTDSDCLTRDELLQILQKNKIDISEFRSGHILMNAELNYIICSGPLKNNKITYCLFDKRISNHKSLSRDEGLKKLATKYFSSHGPATISDFKWWCGLSLPDCRNGLNFIKNDLICERYENEEYWFKDSSSAIKKVKSSVRLIPSFDEYTISYKNRIAAIDLKHQQYTSTFNGIFKPIIVVNGKAAGLWKRTITKDKIFIEADFFDLPSELIKKKLKAEANIFGNFLDKKAEIIL